MGKQNMAMHFIVRHYFWTSLDHYIGIIPINNLLA